MNSILKSALSFIDRGQRKALLSSCGDQRTIPLLVAELLGVSENAVMQAAAKKCGVPFISLPPDFKGINVAENPRFPDMWRDAWFPSACHGTRAIVCLDPQRIRSKIASMNSLLYVSSWTAIASALDRGERSMLQCKSHLSDPAFQRDDVELILERISKSASVDYCAVLQERTYDAGDSTIEIYCFGGHQNSRLETALLSRFQGYFENGESTAFGIRDLVVDKEIWGNLSGLGVRYYGAWPLLCRNAGKSQKKVLWVGFRQGVAPFHQLYEIMDQSSLYLCRTGVRIF